MNYLNSCYEGVEHQIQILCMGGGTADRRICLICCKCHGELIVFHEMSFSFREMSRLYIQAKGHSFKLFHVFVLKHGMRFQTAKRLFWLNKPTRAEPGCGLWCLPPVSGWTCGGGEPKVKPLSSSLIIIRVIRCVISGWVAPKGNLLSTLPLFTSTQTRQPAAITAGRGLSCWMNCDFAGSVYSGLGEFSPQRAPYQSAAVWCHPEQIPPVSRSQLQALPPPCSRTWPLLRRSVWHGCMWSSERKDAFLQLSSELDRWCLPRWCAVMFTEARWSLVHSVPSEAEPTI